MATDHATRRPTAVDRAGPEFRRVVACVCAVLLTGFLDPSAASADDRHAARPAPAEVVVASGGANYEPFHFDADGRAQGFDVDLIRAVGEATGLRIEVRLEDWRLVRSGLETGEIDVHVGMTFSPDRAGKYLFSSPFLSQHYRIFANEENANILDEQDLVGKRIAVQQRGVMADYVVDRGYTDEPLLVTSAADALLRLSTGDADCALLTEFRGLHVSQTLGLEGVVRVGDPIYPTFHGFAVRRDRPELVPLLNQGLALVKKSGEYDRIYERWFGVLDREPTTTWDYFEYAIWIILPLLFAFMVASLWSWSLHRQVVDQTAQLRFARDQAQAASNAKSGFLATMSHEVGTPLNAVLGMAELLAASELDERQRDQVATIRSSATGLQEIISDILAFSKFQQDERRLECQDFSLRELVSEIVENVDVRARAKGLELFAPEPDSLPDRVHGDPEAVRKVMSNLLNNAVKFTHEGQVGLAVDHAWTDDEALHVEVQVLDTGVGIPEEARDGLFDAFTQADSSSTRRYGGTGLGLALCRALVGLMGGTISYAPGPLGGSIFEFSMELRAARETVPEPQPEPASTDGTVLVVEDNPTNQRIVVLMLKKWGFSSDVAENGAEAVEACRRTCYGAIIMDCQMPVMDGIEATVAIREMEQGARRTPIIALTAGAAGHDRETCLAAGMDEYLTKPVDAKRLRSLLESRFEPAPAVVTG